MTPRDRIHLAALRAASTHTSLNRFKGKRRDRESAAFLEVYRVALFHTMNTLNIPVDLDFSVEFDMVRVRGWREVQTQLHILEQYERETLTPTHAKHAEEV